VIENFKLREYKHVYVTKEGKREIYKEQKGESVCLYETKKEKGRDKKRAKGRESMIEVIKERDCEHVYETKNREGDI
jgi:hypothetical protein